MIYDELAAHISGHVSAAHCEPVALTAADFAVSFDSGLGRLRRTVVLDANDDGYFLTVVAVYEADALAGLVCHGEGDRQFTVVGTVELGTPWALRHRPYRGYAADEQRKAKALTADQLRLVLAAMPDDWRTLFTLLAQTGLRISEALGLTWADLDLGAEAKVKVRWQLAKPRRGQSDQPKRVRLKSRHSRRDVPLSAGLARTLRELRAKAYEGEGAPVFASRVGTPLSAHNVRRRVLKPALEPIGFGWVGFHTFRHTCASILFMERVRGGGGKDVKQVQEWLGHADPGLTLRTYVHLMDDGLGGADFFDDVAAEPMQAAS